MDTLGKRIVSIRCTKSRDDFASQYGVHRHTLAKWEADAVLPGEDILYKIATDNGVPLAWLLHGFEGVPPSEPPDTVNMKKADTSAIVKTQPNEIVAFVESKKADRQPFGQEARVLQQENAALNKELRDSMRQTGDLLRQTGDLRVENAELRARVRDLERELREALKPEGGTPPMASAG